jgi:hypothetical protein
VSIIDLALELGLPCFPCRADKKPITAHGFEDASDDPDAIRKMFPPRPGCLIGVPTGAASGIDILDVDPRHGGHVWYAAHKEKLPPTRIHRTRSGGLHRLFRHMDGLRNSTAKIAPGIDTRAEGGYFIWWPATGLEFRDYPPAGLPEWPPWLLPAMMSKPIPPPPPYTRSDLGAVVGRVAGIVSAVANAREGERNNVLFWAACRLTEMVRDGSVSDGAAKDLLQQSAERCGLTGMEALRTAMSASKQQAVRR